MTLNYHIRFLLYLGALTVLRLQEVAWKTYVKVYMDFLNFLEVR
jgi:hypothetical protein